MFKYFVIIASLTCFSDGVQAQDSKKRPNILWITSEDNDYAWLGCYGNELAQTPHLDKLAKDGVQFKHAYSNAPVCAVARSTILNGAYAVTQGTQHMRSKHKTSSKFKPYVSYLREEGYYCTNKTKTDYNYDGPYRELWDDSTSDAHYKNRPDGSPFFAVINLTTSHESSLFSDKIEKNRKKGLIPKETRLSVDEVVVRPYLPDLPEVRSDIAIYHDNITAMDKQVGGILKELDEAGLADDTIVFYYSDHGGVTPRGKRYLKETGVRVPMLLHVPEKWQHLSTFKNGQQTGEMVAFVDLAPTVLSLVGLEIPEQMQGRAFLGKHRKEMNEDKVIFLYADRFDEFYGMRRGLVTKGGKWKYIRRFTPHLSAAPYSFYQFGQQGWQAWQKAWQKGELPKVHARIWESNQVVEELYNLEIDPWEMNNLANSEKEQNRLQSLRKRLHEEMVKNKDSGIIHESMFAELAAEADGVLTNYLSKPEVQIGKLVDAAFATPLLSDVPMKEYVNKNLSIRLKDPSPVVRFWTLQSLIQVGKEATPLESGVIKLLSDKYSANRVSAAHVLFNLGQQKKASEVLIAEIQKDQSQYSVLYAFNVIKQCQLLDDVPNAWVEKMLKIKDDKNYVKRMALQLKK